MDTLTPKQKYYETVGNTIIQNLKKRQIEGYYYPDKISALKKALELIPKGASISWGGSMTIIETGLLDAIKNGDYTVIDRDTASTLDEQRNIWRNLLFRLFSNEYKCNYFRWRAN